MKAYKNRRRELGRLRLPLLAILIFLFGSVPVSADLVFDTGYNIFDDSYPYYDEVWVTNDAHLDVLGGAMWKLELMHHAKANIYHGDMDLLALNDSTVVNIYAPDIGLLALNDNTIVNIHGGTLDEFAAAVNSVAYLYAYDVTYHPTGGLAGEGWIEGIYYSGDKPFSFSLYNRVSYSHLIVAPEPVHPEVKITPATLNLASKGKWLTCETWLPEDYNVADVNCATVRLEDRLAPDWLWFNENQNVLMAKFDRSELEEILDPGDVELTVSGHFFDGTYFTGTDTIKVMDKGHNKK